MHLMHSTFSGSTQGGLALRVEGDFDQARFADALQTVRARHEILNCVIETRKTDDTDSDTLVFVKQEGLPLPLSVVQAQHDDDWRTLLGKLNDTPLPPQMLWRVVVVASPAATPVHDILLLLHHAIMDGSAADTFFDELLAAYAQSGPQQATAAATPLPPCAEHAVPAMMQLDWDAYLAWRRDAPSPGLPPLPHHAQAPLDERHTVFDTVELEPAVVTALDRQAKADGTSLNSCLSAALLDAVGQHTPERKQLTLHSTFSLRRLCAPRIGATDIACCMTIVSTTHTVPAAEPASLAREHHVALAKAVFQQSKQPRTLQMAQLRAAMARSSDQSHFELDLAFTFGESRLQTQYGPLRLVHLYPIVNRRLGNIALAVHGVRLNGKCHFTFNHTAPLQSRQWADQVRRHFLDALSNTQHPFISNMETTA